MWSALNHMLADDVGKLLDRPEFGQEADGERFFSREKTEAVIHAALWADRSRQGGTAGAYAFVNLMAALEIKNWTGDEAEAAMLNEFRNARIRAKAAPAGHEQSNGS
jgi:hypothetical protein